MQNRFADAVPQDPAKVPEYLQELADAMANHTTDVTQELARILNAKHAPLMIPRVTIDAAHVTTNFATTDGATIVANMYLGTSTTTSSSSIQTAVSYTGRGVLTMAILGEFAAAGTAAFNAELKITIDGNVVYDDTACIARESQLHVVVGSLSAIAATSFGVVESGIGLPFNNSCLVQFKSDGTRTITAGWKIAKKL